MAFDGDLDIIIHGCNCQCRMGSGIAKEISERIPQAVRADNATVTGDASKLGTFSYAQVRSPSGHWFVVINAYTQEFWGTDSRKVDYDAVREVFKKIAFNVSNAAKPMRVGYPKVGCGLAGGDWKVISKIIEEELEGLDHTYVEFGG